jgi:glycosyltransferase involved in cell wall biosynthesis
MMKNIAILLSTYNGGEYLKEQLDSIFEQDYQNFTLYVRDDGSTDDTILVLNSYLDKYSNMVVMEDSKRHRGANESFLWLLNHVEADYYMFCDQDDIWLKEKISTQVTAISSVNINDLNAKPVLVFHDLILTTNRGKIMSQSFWETHSMNVKGIKFSEIFVKNVVTG